MSADAVNPIPLLARSLRLTAVPSAVSVSRMFVGHTLKLWQLEDHAETATLTMSELVTNAVKASGITEPEPQSWRITAEHVIGIQLRAIEASLYVEVWDRTEVAPVRKNPSFEAEGGRGLLLVEQLAKRWDVYRPRVGGKVVWAELSLGLPVELRPFEHMPLLLPSGIRASRGPVEDQARTALLDVLLKPTVEAMISAHVDEGP
ncbi:MULTISPECIES: ATP-binding protein [Streptomyces]|uniref:Serine/threonine protein kinase n=1 Tax=Streptomyces autolyticus TaxID=75293 RepID=A0ABM6HM88_9ACTN|nr:MULTISPECIES: ATP-binding protein [Streptomyces]AQA15317.1 serine/threonine protein kinase [Streptomyces autolyticus]MCD9594491.1 ATP-binding protein [Streptomyces sp. 8ZJF_21]